MKWIESAITTASEGIDAVCAMLTEAGVPNVQIEDDADLKNFLTATEGQWDYVDEDLLARLDEAPSEPRVRFYISDNENGRETMLAVRDGIERLRGIDAGLELGSLALATESVDDEGWLNHWKKYYKPFAVGKKIVIRPVWEAYEAPADKIVYVSNPGSVFGTGLHQTTQLCIEQLENYVTPDTAMLDLGFGSGILSVIAMLLGAETVCGVDIDKNAVDIARENAIINGVDFSKIFFEAGNILEDASLAEKFSARQYDVITANIVADVVIAFSEFIRDSLQDNGVVIASGIIDEREAGVKAALTAAGLQILHVETKDAWVCVTAQKVNQK